MVEQVFTIANIGDDDLVIGTIEVGGQHPLDFTITNDNASGQTIAPAADETFGVTFQPTDTGVRSAVVSIPSNDADSPTELLVGGTGVDTPPATDGIASVSPTSWDAGQAEVGVDTLSQVFTVTNVGTGDLTMGTLSVTAAVDFAITADDVSSAVIAPAASETFTVVFDPTDELVRDAIVTIPSDDPASPLEVEVRGEGISGSPTPNPTAHTEVRFFFTRVASPAGVTMSNGSRWEAHPLTETGSYYLSPTKQGNASALSLASDHASITGQPKNVRVSRHVSPPLAAQDLSGRAYRIYARTKASSGTDVQSRVSFARWNSASNTITSLGSTAGTNTSPSKWSTTQTIRRFRQSTVDYEYVIPDGAVFEDGDRLIVELGGRVFTNKTNPSLQITRGAAQSESGLPATPDVNSPGAPWIDLCPGILVYDE